MIGTTYGNGSRKPHTESGMRERHTRTAYNNGIISEPHTERVSYKTGIRNGSMSEHIMRQMEGRYMDGANKVCSWIYDTPALHTCLHMVPTIGIAC